MAVYKMKITRIKMLLICSLFLSLILTTKTATAAPNLEGGGSGGGT
jgi:hypothetical protein